MRGRRVSGAGQARPQHRDDKQSGTTDKCGQPAHGDSIARNIVSMQIRAIRTPRLSAGTTTLLDLIDAAVPDMPPDSVLAITSKIVSLSKR
jgi:hypothetical protein